MLSLLARQRMWGHRLPRPGTGRRPAAQPQARGTVQEAAHPTHASCVSDAPPSSLGQCGVSPLKASASLASAERASHSKRHSRAAMTGARSAAARLQARSTNTSIGTASSRGCSTRVSRQSALRRIRCHRTAAAACSAATRCRSSQKPGKKPARRRIRCHRTAAAARSAATRSAAARSATVDRRSAPIRHQPVHAGGRLPSPSRPCACALWSYPAV